jgi:protoheme IX farnesyltransferase
VKAKTKEDFVLPISQINAYSFSDTLKAVYELGKPKVLSLLLVSTACPMILASGGRIEFWAIFYAILGGSLISSSASVINCIWDMDIDKIMSRTKERPLVTGILSPSFAAGYALVLGFSGVIVLALYLNPLSAALALFGHLFYVFVYTMMLKRTTPQNIVIGGAAGAIPPLVGWAAITNVIELQSILMFLLVFLWTPPHFWALALNKNEDYKLAGVPMLPVVFGEKTTHLQMLMYAIAILPTSILLVFSDSNLSWFSMMVFVSSGVYFIYLVFKLYKMGLLVENEKIKAAKTKQAWKIFAFSIIYLSLIFFTMVVDSALI